MPTISGNFNTVFNRVVPSDVYCYEAENGIVLIQLPTQTTLRIEKQRLTECGSGPWVMGKNFAEFER
jgi:hypothetical protein